MKDSSANQEAKTRIAFTTLGCRVNQYDTQAMREQVERASFQVVPFEEPADIYVINTCTVTAAADAEGKQLVRRAKARNPDSFVVVTGCLAQDRPEEVAALSGVNLVVGNNEKSALLKRIASQYEPLSPMKDDLLETLSPWGGGISRFEGHQRATIKVQDGCNFGCSFCLIPRVRGEMVSRPPLEIVEEGKRLAGNGIKELVLAGIQLSSYGRDWGLKSDEPRLAPVIEKLLAIQGIQRVRLSSYAVVDFEEALLPLWQSKTGLCAHLHLPLQSGDEGILKAMRRPYHLARYRETVEKVRNAAPQIGLTSDIIAGFPSETEEAFENTVARIQEFKFIDLHPFPYSDRPDTPGQGMTPKINPAVIRSRMDRLWELKRECQSRSAQKAIGKSFRVIVERHNREQQAGLTDEGLRVLFPHKEGWLGKEAQVHITDRFENAALAEWVEPVANPLTLYDRLYLRLFYFLRSLRYDLPENRVGWRSRQNQELRFQALMGIGDLQGKSVLDLGCGLGCLYGFLKGRGWEGEYTGIDILDVMVKDARRRFPGVAFEKRDILEAPPARKWDYIFINGVLNHKVKDNWVWIERMVKAAYSFAENGVGFNLLNADVEGEWGDRDLFYADPKVLQEKVGIWSGGNYRIVTGYMPEDITVYMLHGSLQVDPKPQVAMQG